MIWAPPLKLSPRASSFTVMAVTSSVLVTLQDERFSQGRREE